MSPVDGWSAGLDRVRLPLLESVVASVLARLEDPTACTQLPKGAAGRAVALVLPAVLSLVGLSRTGVLGPWDGLVHRRCSVETGDGSEPSTALTPLGARAGWELERARVVVPHVLAGQAWPDGAVVTHDLARRTPVDEPEGGRSEGAATTSRRPIVPVGGQRAVRPRGAAVGVARRKETGATLGMQLRADDVAAWAQAAGDGNAVHTTPGAARAAGLEAGPDELVAHGLLLAALSLAAVPPHDGHGFRFRLVAPATLPVEGTALLELELSTGHLAQAGSTVLVRH